MGTLTREGYELVSTQSVRWGREKGEMEEMAGCFESALNSFILGLAQLETTPLSNR